MSMKAKKDLVYTATLRVPVSGVKTPVTRCLYFLNIANNNEQDPSKNSVSDLWYTEACLHTRLLYVLLA